MVDVQTVGGLWQLHHEHPDGSTEFRSQHEPTDLADFTRWLQETNECYPLPQGLRWVLLNETDQRFLWGVDDACGSSG